MSFERTNNGLSNTHLFHSADYVVYVEGKFDENNNDLASYDQYFWRSITESTSPGTTFKFISRGSKIALLPIAQNIISGQVSNTLIALDRDYDFECGSHISHPKIIYTRGYSWENDVWNSESLLHLLNELNIGEAIDPDKANEIEKCVSDFCRKARRVAHANVTAKQNGQEYIFPASQMRGLVDLPKNKLPRFNHQLFCSIAKRADVPRPIHMLSKLAMTDGHIQGHLMAHFGYHFVCRGIALLGHKGNICINHLSTIAINLLKRQLLTINDPRRIYYEECFSNATT